MLYNQEYIYKGAIHIHSNLSDGSGDLKRIVKAAKKSNLDWIIITDHNYYDSEEGFFDGICVIKGEEISPKNYNHYLAIGINECVNPDENAEVYVKRVRELGGFGFSAHPDEGIKNDGSPRKNSHHCIPWTNKNIKPDGVEIWNWFSNWADNLNDKTILNLAYSYLFKHKIVKGASKLTLDWWDKLNNEADEIVPAIGGIDAHALKFYKYIIPVTVFPYETCFNTITNYIQSDSVLSKDFNVAKSQILNAIKQGNNVITNRHVTKDFPKIFVTNSKGAFYCGVDIELDNNCCLHFESYEEMKICLIYNGNVIKEVVSDKFIYQITKTGKYRLEVLYKGQPFLYTNPFNIND